MTILELKLIESNLRIEILALQKVVDAYPSYGPHFKQYRLKYMQTKRDELQKRVDEYYRELANVQHQAE